MLQQKAENPVMVYVLPESVSEPKEVWSSQNEQSKTQNTELIIKTNYHLQIYTQFKNPSLPI